MKSTHHSEYGQLKSIYIKPATESFLSQGYVNEQWQELNYLGCPQYDEAVSEYEQFEKLIKATGADVRNFTNDHTVKMDSIYCRDASIATDWGLIICNMGKAGRANEPFAAKKLYEANKESILGVIEAPGTIEGGDVAWLDDNTLAIGRTYRTNDSGIVQMKALLEPKGVEIIVVELPHYKGSSDVFHLMSILSPVDKDLAVVYSPLMPIKFRNELLQRGIQLIDVPDGEFESMGCNVLAVAPRDCLMVDGNPITKKLLENAGCQVFSYKGHEISVKGGGGPTCLTRPMERIIL